MTKKNITRGLLVGWLSASGIEGATLAYSLKFPNTNGIPTRFTSTFGEARQGTFNVPQFDPTLGELTSVTILTTNTYLFEAIAETEVGLAIPSRLAPLGFDWIGSYSWLVETNIEWSGPGFTVGGTNRISESTPYTSEEFPIPIREVSDVLRIVDSGVVVGSTLSQYVGDGSVPVEFFFSYFGLDPFSITGGLAPAGVTVTGINSLNSASLNYSIFAETLLEYGYEPSVVPEPKANTLLLVVVTILIVWMRPRNWKMSGDRR